MGIDPFEFERARQRERLETRRNEFAFILETTKQSSKCLNDRIDALQAGLSSIQRYEAGLETVRNSDELRNVATQFDKELDSYAAKSNAYALKFEQLSKRKRFEDDDNDNR